MSSPSKPLTPFPRPLGALLLVALSVLVPAAPSLLAQDGGAASAQLEDRILAVVDEDPILDSDVERLVALGLIAPKPGESDDAFRRRLLEELIEQRLRFHAIERFGFEEVPVAAVDEQVAAIRARFPDQGSFAAELARLGLNERGLRQLLTRQLMVLTYVEERLGPRIFVRTEEIESYYRDVLTPKLKAGGAEVPPIEEVRDQMWGYIVWQQQQ